MSNEWLSVVAAVGIGVPLSTYFGINWILCGLLCAGLNALFIYLGC